MAKTTNLGLNLTTDENTLFADWRKSIDGTDNSNMQIIDKAIGELQKNGGSGLKVTSIHNGSTYEECFSALANITNGGSLIAYSFGGEIANGEMADCNTFLSYTSIGNGIRVGGFFVNQHTGKLMEIGFVLHPTSQDVTTGTVEHFLETVSGGGMNIKTVEIKSKADLDSFFENIDSYKNLVSMDIGDGNVLNIIGWSTDSRSKYIHFLSTGCATEDGEITDFDANQMLMVKTPDYPNYQMCVKVNGVFNKIDIDDAFFDVGGLTIRYIDGSGSIDGGITETRVNELINQALGVIENGTY